MRLSLWQQFSSNHSGGFSLVGQFESVEAAQKAHAVILDIINQIAAYYREHPELSNSRFLLPPTPVEEELAKQYGLTDNEWEFSVDWAEVEADPRSSNQGLFIYQNLLFLSEAIETWLGAPPFDKLFTKLGAKIEVANFGIDEVNFEPAVDMTCVARNEVDAAQLVKILSSSESYTDDSIQPLIVLPDGFGPYEGEISCDGVTVICKGIHTSSFSRKKSNGDSPKPLSSSPTSSLTSNHRAAQTLN